MSQRHKTLYLLSLFLLLGSSSLLLLDKPRSLRASAYVSSFIPTLNSSRPHQIAALRIAAIGDFGYNGPGTKAVARLIDNWQPDIILSLGDNNYEDGTAQMIEQNIGQFYSSYIFPNSSHTKEPINTRFFPALGNHDWHAENAQPYLDYFPIDHSQANTNSSQNERYYDFVQGPVHFFVLNSDRREPDGNTVDSRQASWLQKQLAQSTTPWQIVYFHHSPYSSGEKHGSYPELRWPFAEWGVDAVLSAHDHTYERLEKDGLVYFVNGLGGRGPHRFSTLLPESKTHFTGTDGAMFIAANKTDLTFEFYSIAFGGLLIDSYKVSTTLTAVDTFNKAAQ